MAFRIFWSASCLAMMHSAWMPPLPPTTARTTSTTLPVPSSTNRPCPQFDCNAAYNALCPPQWMMAWSEDTKLHCCDTARRGCPLKLPVLGEVNTGQCNIYDCDFDYNDDFACLAKFWFHAKIEYCRLHFHKGCPPKTTATTAMPLPEPSTTLPASTYRPCPQYDCNAAYNTLCPR